MTNLRLETPRSVQRTTVIEVRAMRGAGVEGDPVRTVMQYWSLEGELLAERDPQTDVFDAVRGIAEEIITSFSREARPT